MSVASCMHGLCAAMHSAPGILLSTRYLQKQPQSTMIAVLHIDTRGSCPSATWNVEEMLSQQKGLSKAEGLSLEASTLRW